MTQKNFAGVRNVAVNFAKHLPEEELLKMADLVDPIVDELRLKADELPVGLQDLLAFTERLSYECEKRHNELD